MTQWPGEVVANSLEEHGRLTDQFPGEVVGEDNPGKAPALSTSAPQVKAGDYQRRSTIDPNLALDETGRVMLSDTGQAIVGQDTGFIGEKGGTHSELMPSLAGANEAVAAMIKSGVSNDDIIAYLKKRGYDDAGLLGIQHQLLDIRAWQAKYPQYKGDYYVDVERRDVPNSALQNVMGSDVGTAATSAGNAGTAFALPKIAGLAGADPNEVQANIDAAETAHPKSAVIGTVAGGVGASLGLEQGLAATGVKGLARTAPGEVAEGVAALAPVIRPLVADTLYGGTAGAVTTDTNDEGQPATAMDRLEGAGEGALAAVAGHVTGHLVGGGAGLSATRAADAQDANRDFAGAAQRQGIDYMAADLPKSTKSKFFTALSNISLGGIPLAEAGERNVATGRAAVQRVAGDIGSVSDKTGAGQAAQRGARQFMGETEAKESSLYDAIPIPDDGAASVANSRAALTSLSQSFRSNKKLAKAFDDPKLKAYLDALTPQTEERATGLLDASGKPITETVEHSGNLSWFDLKDFRSRIGKIIGKPGLESDGQQIGQLRALYGALSEDMRATAANYGPQASRAFERANTYARARANRIENVVSLILGKSDDKAAQSAFEALQRLGIDKGGDPIKLAQALRSMPEDEANAIRATILDDMATASAGKQNAAGDVFSPAEFMTNWNKLSPRAKSILFGGEHAKALDDITKVLSGMKASAKFANTSKTGLAVAAAHTTAALIHNPVLGIVDMAMQYGSGKLLASRRYARWLSGLAKKPNAKAAAEHIDRLEGIARAEPEIAEDVRSLQRRLAETFAQGSKTRRALTVAGAQGGAALATQQQ